MFWKTIDIQLGTKEERKKYEMYPHKPKYVPLFLREYWLARKYFVKPNIKIGFSKWKNAPGLPVYRRSYAVLPKWLIYVNDKLRLNWFVDPYNEKAKQTLGYKLDIDKSERRRKMPKWLSFNVTNLPIMWKTKWEYDDVRFEWNPQFSLTLFGITFWVQVYYKNNRPGGDVDNYWEMMIYYLYFSNKEYVENKKKDYLRKIEINNEEPVSEDDKKDNKYYQNVLSQIDDIEFDENDRSIDATLLFCEYTKIIRYKEDGKEEVGWGFPSAYLKPEWREKWRKLYRQRM
jgi:hypothetical protein